MNVIRQIQSRIKQASITVILLSFSQLTLAEATPEQVEAVLVGIHDIQVSSYRSSNEVYAYPLEDLRSAYQGSDSQKSIAATLAKGTSVVNNLTTLLTPVELQDEAQTIQDLWAAYKQILTDEETPITDSGYVDGALLSILGTARQELLGHVVELEEAVTEKYADIINQEVYTCLQQSSQITAMGMIYTARTAGTWSAVGWGIDLAESAEQFGEKLAAMNQKEDNSEEILKELNKIKLEFNFIKPTMTEYNVKTVPLIVSRYTKNISTSFVELTYMYKEGHVSSSITKGRLKETE